MNKSQPICLLSRKLDEKPVFGFEEKKGFEDVLPGDASGDAGREGHHLAPAQGPIKYFKGKKEEEKPARGPIKYFKGKKE